MAKLYRRKFLQWLLGGVAFYLLTGCFPKASETPLGTPTILKNENRPGFYIRYYRPFSPPSIGEWELSVEGMVQNPVKLNFDDLKEFPFEVQASRLKCVECWSAAARWGGFRFAPLLKLVKALPQVKWVHFYCADGYYESLTLEEALNGRTLLVYRMNDAILPPEYGGPLRVIVPSKYGYKSPKLITRIIFAREELTGYWPSVGPYSPRGDILPGVDHPLDLKGPRRIQEGEIIYPDGLESGTGRE